MNNAAVGRGYDPQSWTFATGKIKLYASINMSPRYDNYIILYIHMSNMFQPDFNIPYYILIHIVWEPGSPDMYFVML